MSGGGWSMAVTSLSSCCSKGEGCPWGPTTAYTFAAVMAAFILHRRLGGLEGRRLAPVLGQILVAGAATGGASWLVARWVSDAVGTALLGPQLLQGGRGVVAGLGPLPVIAM